MKKTTTTKKKTTTTTFRKYWRAEGYETTGASKTKKLAQRWFNIGKRAAKKERAA